jgi:TatD DNase family protein
MLIDTHCHIHEANYPDASGTLERARHAGVGKIICVGTDNATSHEAAEFAKNHEGVYYSVGAHPHDSKDGYDEVVRLAKERAEKLVAIGEIGLDYFYTHSPREVQMVAFEAQLQLACDQNLPVIFHVREAFDDFWPIFRNFSKLRGVLHSFTDTRQNMEKGLSEGLLIGVNGISTFAKDEAQRAMFDAIPLEKMLLETDAPFLTPTPNRGKVNEPAFVRHVAEYHAKRRGIELEHLARVTSANATTLFSI